VEQENPPQRPVDASPAEAVVDGHEYHRWISTARRHAGLAEVARREGYPEGAVLHAEQAAQCALKALLHGVGQRAAARGHGLVQLAEACGRLADLAVSDQLVSGLRDLATTYLSSRYPDALPDGTPADHYDEPRARRSITTAMQTIDAVEQQRVALDSSPGVADVRQEGP